MKTHQKSLVICPVYNEGKTLRKFYTLLRHCYQGDVLFVNDGSTDEGRDLLIKLKNEYTFVVHHPRRYGYGSALLSGFHFAQIRGYSKVVTIDADLQHHPSYIGEFLKRLDEFEVVLGSRYVKLENYPQVPVQRLVINRYISKLIEVIWGTRFSDPFCGLRGYRSTFLNRADLKERSYGLSLEILLKMIELQVNFFEVPVEAIYFKDIRKFLDGLDDPRRRLLYYLDVISSKKKEYDKKIPSCKPPS